MSTDNQTTDQLKMLVDRFGEHIDQYKNGTYNEIQLRRDFIDPFFEALGWDVFNRQGYAEAYRDVIHEDALKVGGATRAPDYCFRIGGMRKFFVEAKKPSVNIKDDISPAFQVRRYAWSAKLPLSILTDFEEFAVYDTRIKPVKTDKASVGRVFYSRYIDYLDRWAEISGIFSHEAILKGSFDKYVASHKKKRGTAEVDDEFLAEMEEWRKRLAMNMALRNPNLTQRELNHAVQLTIDRIVFLRICEDRGIEDYGRLQALMNGAKTYPRLLEYYRRADEKYNSGLFHFEDEKGRSGEPDKLTPSLKIDDKQLKDMFRKLYYPESPYVFSEIPADILGQVYEQFLGKVIRLTGGHQAKVEEKPEVRKAGGVYYTPTYIVDYIVKNTIGKIIENKSPKQVSKLRFLDPACGSGSFLLGAYQFLLDWHKEWYRTNDPAKHAKGRKPALYESQNGWELATAEKKRILLNNIYGVDIDSQAVEVTKLSLLLKVLEGETSHKLTNQIRMFHERALPDLRNNIKCGNSLIGTDFYEGKDMSLFGEDEMYRINVFDWNTEFAETMKNGGFDAVIGNPPYVFGRDWNELNIDEKQKEYFKTIYSASPYQLDMFSLFIEKASILCRKNGHVGQIVPNVWLTNTYSSVTRAFILSQSKELVIAFPTTNVFKGITVDTIVYTQIKSETMGESFKIVSLYNNNVTELSQCLSNEYVHGEKPISSMTNNISSVIAQKLIKENNQLLDFAEITRGVHPYRLGGYGQSAFIDGPQIKRDMEDRPYHSNIKEVGYRPFIYGKNLKKFTPPTGSEYIKYGKWLAEPRNPKFFEGTRIYSRKILSNRLLVTIEKDNTIADQQVYITIPTNSLSAQYLAGILGSELIAFFIRAYYDENTQAFPQIKIKQLKEIPIRTIDFDDAEDKARHDRMVEMVESMLSLNKRLAEAKTDHEKNMLKRQINHTDKQIDQLVYELYNLTEDEIKIAEE